MSRIDELHLSVWGEVPGTPGDDEQEEFFLGVAECIEMIEAAAYNLFKERFPNLTLRAGAFDIEQGSPSFAVVQL